MPPRAFLLRLTTLAALVFAAAVEAGWKWDHFLH